MEETDAWNSFLATGSVLDYLQYRAIQNAKNFDNHKPSEDTDEILYGRTNNQGAEYR